MIPQFLFLRHASGEIYVKFRNVWPDVGIGESGFVVRHRETEIRRRSGTARSKSSHHGIIPASGNINDGEDSHFRPNRQYQSVLMKATATLPFTP